MRDGLGIEPRGPAGSRTRSGSSPGSSGSRCSRDNLVFRTQVGVHRRPRSTSTRAAARRSPSTATTSRRSCRRFPRRQEFGNNNNHERNDLYSLQFSEPARVVPQQQSARRAQLPLKDHFYTEQETCRAPRSPGDLIYELQRHGAGGADHLLLERSALRGGRATAGRSAAPTSLRNIVTPHRHLAADPLPDHHPGALARLGRRQQQQRRPPVHRPAPSRPRVSVAWDATHDGRTVLRASYNHTSTSTSAASPATRLGGRPSSSASGTPPPTRTTRSCVYSGGLPATPSARPAARPASTPTGKPLPARSWRSRAPTSTPLGGEREVVAGRGAVARPHLPEVHQPVRDPRDQPDLEQPASARARPAATATAATRPSWISAPRTGANRRYAGVTAGVNKREGRFKPHGSYTWSQLVGQRLRRRSTTPGATSPARDVYLYGYLPDDHRHEVKAQHQLPGHQAGCRWACATTTPPACPTTGCSATTSPASTSTTARRVGINPGTNSTTPATTARCGCPTSRSVNAAGPRQPAAAHRAAARLLRRRAERARPAHADRGRPERRPGLRRRARLAHGAVPDPAGPELPLLSRGRAGPWAAADGGIHRPLTSRRGCFWSLVNVLAPRRVG